MRIRCASLVIAIALLFAVQTAQATELPAFCNGATYDAQLTQRYFKDVSGQFPCIAGASVEFRAQQIHESFYKGNSATARSDSTIRVDGAAMLSTWPEQARRQLAVIQTASGSTLAGGSPAFQNVAAQYTQALNKLVKDSATLATVNDWSISGVSPEPERLPDYWKVNADIRPEPGALPARYLAAENCLNATHSERCDDVYKQATVLADEVYLVDKIVSIMASKDRVDFVDQAAAREKQWHAYLYDTQFQYWWELGINRYVEVQCPVIFRWMCKRPPRDKYDNELGFRVAPSEKLMILHPDIGVSYLHAEPDGQKFKPVVVFQWLGYQHWNWQDNAVSGLKGLAIVTTVADTSRAKRVGTGVQLQWQRYSLAITSHGGDIAFTISLNVIDWIGTVNPNWADKLKAPLPK